MDLIEDISKIQVIDVEIEVKPDEVSWIECAGTAEDLAIYHLARQEDLEVVLDGLQEVTSVDIGELVVPNLDVVLLNGRAIQVPP